MVYTVSIYIKRMKIKVAFTFKIAPLERLGPRWAHLPAPRGCRNMKYKCKTEKCKL